MCCAGGLAARGVDAVCVSPNVRGGRGDAPDAQPLSRRWKRGGAVADESCGAGTVWCDRGLGAMAGAATAEGRGRAALCRLCVAGGADAGGNGAAGLSEVGFAIQAEAPVARAVRFAPFWSLTFTVVGDLIESHVPTC